MKSSSRISQADFERLAALDTCTASNAIERLNVRLRNEGFISSAVRCRFRSFEPMLAYAVTGRIRTTSPPMAGRCYYDRIDFWKYLASVPAPRVMVIQDVDPRPGLGAFVGEIHAAIGSALNCIGYITNGSVRDLPAVNALHFHLFSGSVAVSHSYAHLIEFGAPVEIGGLKISSGDLMHGDLHGVQSIPLEIASKVPAEAAKVASAENLLKEYCRSPQFSLDQLEEKIRSASADCL
jgi:4-hydroxy-4-methyl-2-oxoglutarate aldolase